MSKLLSQNRVSRRAIVVGRLCINGSVRAGPVILSTALPSLENYQRQYSTPTHCCIGQCLPWSVLALFGGRIDRRTRKSKKYYDTFQLLKVESLV